MDAPTTTCALDEAVHRVRAQLDGESVLAPDALLMMATGAETFSQRLGDLAEFELHEWDGVPGAWREAVLFTGRLGQVPVWLLSDLAGEPSDRAATPGWAGAFPVWLAAAHGASVCVHTSAGSGLEERVPVGGFAFVRDHINLSGDTPLIGLGDSRLGPLFPDLSLLHHVGLRRAALDRAEKLGLPACEAVCVCTPGPALETPAERRMWATVGGEVAVQGLATPLLAAAHAGLACLALVAVTDSGEGPADVTLLLQRAAASEPALEDLLVELAGDLHDAASVLNEEESA